MHLPHLLLGLHLRLGLHPLLGLHLLLGLRMNLQLYQHLRLRPLNQKTPHLSHPRSNNGHLRSINIAIYTTRM